jgi:hypothetical protein
MDSSSSGAGGAGGDPLSGLNRPTNNARGQSSSTTAPIIDATQVGGGSSTLLPSPMIELNRRPSSLARARIEGMDQLEKSVMDDGSSNDFHGNYANMTDAEKNMKEEELSFYSASDNDCGDDNIWGLLSGIGGNIYEWYVYYYYYVCVCVCVFILLLSFARVEKQTLQRLIQSFIEFVFFYFVL